MSRCLNNEALCIFQFFVSINLRAMFALLTCVRPNILGVGLEGRILPQLSNIYLSIIIIILLHVILRPNNPLQIIEDENDSEALKYYWKVQNRILGLIVIGYRRTITVRLEHRVYWQSFAVLSIKFASLHSHFDLHHPKIMSTLNLIYCLPSKHYFLNMYFQACSYRLVPEL